MSRRHKEIPVEMTRAVPVEMLQDRDFLNILKEKAKNSAPDSGSEVSESYYSGTGSSSVSEAPPPRRSGKKAQRRQNMLTKAAMNPARIIDPYDRQMIPQIERRVADREERRERAAQLYRREPLPEQEQKKNIVFGLELPEWFGVKMYIVATLAVFVLLILIKRNFMARKLGFSYALAAELPFLASVLSGFSGVPSQQMLGEIRAFDQGIHPVLNPNPLQQQPPPQQPQQQQQPAPAQQAPPLQQGRQPITQNPAFNAAQAAIVRAQQQAPLETEEQAPLATEEQEQPTQAEPEQPQMSPEQQAALERQQTIEMLTDEALAWAQEEREDVQEEAEGEDDDNEDEYEDEEVTKKRKKLDVPTTQIQRGKPLVIKNALSKSQAQTYKPPQQTSLPSPQPVAPKKPESAKEVRTEQPILRTKRPEKPDDVDDIPGVSRGKEAREQAREQALEEVTASDIPGLTKEKDKGPPPTLNGATFNMEDVDE